MAIDKDYYAILGVHPTVEIAAIEAIIYVFCNKVTSDMKKTERFQIGSNLQFKSMQLIRNQRKIKLVNSHSI